MIKYPPQGNPDKAEVRFGQFNSFENTNAFVINSNDVWQGYHIASLTNLVNGVIFNAGYAGTPVDISSVADAGGGDITVTTSGVHSLSVGDIVSISGCADSAYNGVFTVLTVPTTSTFTVTATYTATDTGKVDKPAYLEVSSSGNFEVDYDISATNETNNETFDFIVFKNAVKQDASESRRKFGTATDFGSSSGGSIMTLVAGDRLFFALKNNTGTGNLTIRYLNFRLKKL